MPVLELVPVAEPTKQAVTAVCAVLGLGHAWVPVLRRLGEDLSEPMAWRRRFLADTEPVTVRDLRVVALRTLGLTPTRIASRIGRRSVPPRHHIDRICLAVAVRLADPDWQDGALGARRPGAASHRLVHDGIPAYTDDPVSQDAFDRLWLQGLPLEEMRAVLSIGPKVAKAHAAAAPPRWAGKDVAAFFGWSRENHRLRLARGHFPKPDGTTVSSSGATKDWWWPSTVTEWAAAQPFVRCPECNASVARLKQHLTKHQRRGS
ncbi:hypothetical protein [Phycicoccus sp. SLBN-51]|uniref:hypothetical protein n=1 Tax=Phycicoccus sp. SLBN-51 TaxID=2768447 RepID=UPI001150C019|nr:hypothetical protein [Phycicoccus sp. SLBN-51]TQJ49282.1 hypothetical protein FBY26_0960 [Phycicoccus sp. SLBN-51]